MRARQRMKKQSRLRRLAKRALPKRLLARRRQEYARHLAAKRPRNKFSTWLQRAAAKTERDEAIAATQRLAATYCQVTGLQEQGANDG